MKLPPGVRRLFRLPGYGPRILRDLDEEMRAHIAMRVDELRALGMNEAEAEAEALRRFGDAEEYQVYATRRAIRLSCRLRIFEWLAEWTQDVRFAARQFRNAPGFTAIAVLTLALGIGANTAMFSILNGMLLHPLPYPNADRIALVFLQPRGAPAGSFIISPEPEQLLSWRTQARSFAEVEAFDVGDRSLLAPDGGVAVLRAAIITPSFSSFAGQRPVIGRGFSTADTVYGAARVALLSEHVWRTRFGGSEQALGKSITLDGEPYDVVGVLPDELSLPLRSARGAPDVWLPLDLGAARGAMPIVRLRPGVSLAVATSELEMLRARAELPSDAGASRWLVTLRPPRSLVGPGDTLIMLWAAGALVLLIACVNVSHLLLARSAGRERELAIRAALGAGRWRLVRQLLTEGSMLAAAGCVAGVWLGWIGLRELVAWRPAELTMFGAPRLDDSVLALTLGVSAIAAIAFGLAGAWRLGRRSTSVALRVGAPFASAGRGQHRVRSALVVTEMALSVVLLVGATLLVRSVVHLASINPGFDARGVYSVRVIFPPGDSSTSAVRAAFMKELAARAGALPGVHGVAFGDRAPPELLGFGDGTVRAEGGEPIPLRGGAFVRATNLSPDYFKVVGLPLVDGSTFTDSSSTLNQIVINQTLANTLWPGQRAVGQRLRLGGMIAVGPEQWEVVGVVADAAVGGLLHAPTLPAIYQPISHPADVQVIVRTDGSTDPSAQLRWLIVSMNPRLPPAKITSVENVLAESMAPVRFAMTILLAFTGIALLLAAVGLYGVLAHAVAQRRGEIGIRIALGATPRQVTRLVVGQGVALAMIGGAVGLVASWWATRIVVKLLYGVTRTDPLSFAIGAVVLLGAALVACRVPARRALRVDPVEALREL
ncbi:MAG TPA: ABC transporter permease [Gemmatimonadaceae bacterium]|nr:ABC transporter permease [Gemmatimonadaceae bacterium]